VDLCETSVALCYFLGLDRKSENLIKFIFEEIGKARLL
jgi:hypothetical protein